MCCSSGLVTKRKHVDEAVGITVRAAKDNRKTSQNFGIQLGLLTSILKDQNVAISWFELTNVGHSSNLVFSWGHFCEHTQGWFPLAEVWKGLGGSHWLLEPCEVEACEFPRFASLGKWYTIRPGY